LLYVLSGEPRAKADPFQWLICLCGDLADTGLSGKKPPKLAYLFKSGWNAAAMGEQSFLADQPSAQRFNFASGSFCFNRRFFDPA